MSAQRNHFTVNHMGLDPKTRTHVTFAYYPAGHIRNPQESGGDVWERECALRTGGIRASELECRPLFQ